MRGRPFPRGTSGNPGGRPRVVAALRDLARQHAPASIKELARLALKAKSEAARVAAIRELLDRGYGRPGPASVEADRFVIPELRSAGDASKVMSQIVSAVTLGNLSAGEASELSHLIGMYLETLATADFERRLQLLEEQQPREPNK
jgi:hypothetical protein